ncbi:hypothetical protein BO70DRAFT_393690 [Aspergillus heteromorphus CBS 117.55]|uniref:Uncharacterized protein n=1 Tax=Aspergillus heteromorphus CBS 117.55 TaxID=1448321 RepID=A0A317WYA2_9EURO|nr:uncharacterized protein BO70DRAFT_393690 [Aspergillus heteromorphus CBS 117.55]PWY89180.1 hypothetical protein BO70DRAFT_393690 [Aspergillus heteromorphus CBS 117.55]
MVKNLTFDVRYDNELAHEYYGEGSKLAATIRQTYHDRDLEVPDEYDSTLTTPPIHFMSVSAPDTVDVDNLKGVQVPPGLNIEILDFDM